VLATVAGVLVAPRLADDPVVAVPEASLSAAHVGVARSPRTVEPRLVRRLVGGPVRGGLAGAGVRPVRLAPIEVGVATMNLFRQNTPAQAAADARRLTSHPQVDVVGWQEADRSGGALRGIPGWTTKTFRLGSGISELAVSWRSAEFRLLSARQHKVALGLSWREGRYPFDARHVAVVRLQHRASGRILTVLDTHLPQKIEDFHHPGRWLSTINSIRARAQLQRLEEIWTHAGGRWVVATGDFNFGARADAREHPPGGPLRTLRRAVSTYERLGSGIGPTHPPTARNIDYVWVDRAGLRHGQIAIRDQRVLGGYQSDHRPLLARLRLS
jgi:endonuclease/exonuclease/phosphatase family metal-dependent hydrolase